MRTCLQFRDQDVYEHGLSVRRRYTELRDHLLEDVPLRTEWRLPDWIRSPDIIRCLEDVDEDVVEAYQVYHDCGKPMCRVVDPDGRQHFPDHARVSRERFLECSDGRGTARMIADLIGMDMDVHKLRASDLEEFRARPQALTLLITALCEVHANSEMFGGIDSVGFKIKWKHLDRFGGRMVTPP
jgi:hypothetical protein